MSDLPAKCECSACRCPACPSYPEGEDVSYDCECAYDPDGCECAQPDTDRVVRRLAAVADAAECEVSVICEGCGGAGEDVGGSLCYCRCRAGDEARSRLPHRTIVVTRHAALVQLLRQRGMIDDTTPILPHADADEVRGQDVIGVLPLHLAALARSVTVIPIDWPRDGPRGVELTIDELQARAGPAVRYQVRVVGADD